MSLLALGMSAACAEENWVAAGTVVHCRLNQTISMKLNYQGDPLLATVSEFVTIDGRDAIPVGATLEGRIVHLQRLGRVQGAGETLLRIERLTLPYGRTFPFSDVLATADGTPGVEVSDEEGPVKGPRSRLEDLQEAGLGTGGWGFPATLMGGFHGTVIGGAISVAAGFVDSLHWRGKDLTLPTGTALDYHLPRPLEARR